MRTCWIFLVISFLARAASSQVGDFSGDGLLNCQDIDLLNAEIQRGTNSAVFDLDDSGAVNRIDLYHWLDTTGAARGYSEPIFPGDANVDGRVDHLDLNIFGMRHHMQAAGWCEGDFDGDGIATNHDRDEIEVRWTMASDKNIPTNRFAASVTIPPPAASLDVWAAGGFTFAQTEHFQFVSIPQRAPDGVLTTVVAIHTRDTTDRIVTLTNLAITGDVHQAWLSGIFGSPTAWAPTAGPTYHESWIPYDSHVLITQLMIGDGISYINETNDGSNPVSATDMLPEIAFGIGPTTGFGDLLMSNPTDAFFLDPFTRRNSINLAYLVTPATSSNRATAGEVFLTLGVLGGDANNEPIPNEGIIGLDQPIAIPFFAEPCDINTDGVCDVDDLNQLLAALGTENSEVNLDRSNSLIDLSDRDAWLADAQMGVPGVTFVTGDTDLDGDVDASDLNNLGIHWRMSGQLGWRAGDFDGSGTVDAADLNTLSLNWQHGSVATTAVPEPHHPAWLLAWSTATLMFRLCKRRGSSG